MLQRMFSIAAVALAGLMVSAAHAATEKGLPAAGTALTLE